MRFFKQPLNIDFMGKRRLAVAISVVFIVLSLGSLVVRGLNFGIDFTGGMLIEVGYKQAVELGPVRDALAQSGFDRAIVQHFGTAQDVLVRLPPEGEERADADLSTRVLRSLHGTGDVEMRRVEFVGPQVGEELTEQGGLAMLGAVFGILIYVMLRFEKRFALGSVVALVHDVIVTLGVFSLFWLEFDLTVFAAVLAVIGYSLNDTIVIFDRVRENFRKVRKGEVVDVVNLSINQTMSRTIITSGTTLVVLTSLFLVGGEIIHNFALALIVGIIAGTYSTIYVATAAALALGVSRVDLMPVKKEGADVDARP